MSDQQFQVVEADSGGDARPPSRRSVVEGDRVANDHRMYATLAHLLGIVSGPLGPFVIWLIMRGDSKVEPQAREALNFQITVWLIGLVGAILMVIYIGTVIIVLSMVLNVVFSVIAASHAHAGMPYRYPFSLRLIDSTT